MQMNYWSKEEVWILREHYSKMGATALMEMLPGRSLKSIKIQASRQGLSVSKHVTSSIKRDSGFPDVFMPWTQRDIKLLTSLYPIYGASGLLDVFHERSRKSISRKARELGISMEKAARDDMNRELARRGRKRTQVVASKFPVSEAPKDFSEYEKVSSIFSVGRRCQALFDGGFVQGD